MYYINSMNKSQYIEAPNYTNINNKHSIFLAGGITGCSLWQNTIKDKLLSTFDHLTVINPRRENFQMFKDKSQYNESLLQIDWEYKYLRLATQILFWFTNETIQPIVLFELGATLERWKIYTKQELFIGCHPDYVRSFDVVIQTKLSGYTTPICTSLDKLIESVVIYNKNIQRIKP